MRKLAFTAAVVVALALSPGALAAGALSGKYRAVVPADGVNETWTLSFSKAKKTYTVRGPFPGSITGKNTYSGSTVTFNHESTGSECKHRAGRYTFKVTGRTLKLTRISDPCIIRRTIFSHKLTKIG